MEAVEITQLTGGLVLRPSADDIQKHQVQSAENVDFTLEPGVVRVRRGIAKEYETEFSGGIDIFWQSIFGAGGLMVRAGSDLYDGEDHLIISNLTNANMQFEQFDDWLIFCNGVDTMKYKRSGMELSWNTSYTAAWEENYTSSDDYAVILVTLYTTTDYRCCFSWEVEQVQDEEVVSSSPYLYTAVCYVGIMADSTTTWVLGDNKFIYGSTVATSSSTTFPANRVFKGCTGTYIGDVWRSDASNTQWFKFTLASAVIPGQLTMRGTEYFNINPNKFTFKASTTGAFTGEEVTLVTEPGCSWTTTWQWRAWDFKGDVGVAYKYYKMEITGKQSAFGEAEEYWISCIRLYEAQSTTSDTGEVSKIARDYFPPVNLGLPQADASSSAAAEGAGGNPSGAYMYAVTYRNAQGFEGNYGEFSGSTDITVSGKIILLTDLPISDDIQVVERRIYRTEAGGSTYKLVVTIENNWQTTYTDNIADTSLGADAPEDHDAPPPFSEIHSHRGLLWGIEAAAENKAWYCNQFDEWEYYPPTYYENFGSGSDRTLNLETLA